MISDLVAILATLCVLGGIVLMFIGYAEFIADKTVTKLMQKLDERYPEDDERS